MFFSPMSSRVVVSVAAVAVPFALALALALLTFLAALVAVTCIIGSRRPVSRAVVRRRTVVQLCTEPGSLPVASSREVLHIRGLLAFKILSLESKKAQAEVFDGKPLVLGKSLVVGSVADVPTEGVVRIRRCCQATSICSGWWAGVRVEKRVKGFLVG